MNSSLYGNPWFIALATILLTYLFSPILNVLVDWISSRRGRLTGTYLALTEDHGDGLLVERVACWQTGNRLVGRIQAVCRVRLSEGQVKEYWAVSGRYKFSGRVAGSVLSLLYWMPQKAQNAGSITFKSTIMGDVLDGTWSGLDESQNIGYAPCTWVRIRKRDFPKEDLLQFATAINAALILIPTRWRHKNTPPRKSVIYKVNASSSKHMISGEIAREIASRKGQSSSLNSGPGLARSVGTAQPDGFAETENDKRVSGSDTA